MKETIITLWDRTLRHLTQTDVSNILLFSFICCVISLYIIFNQNSAKYLYFWKSQLNFQWCFFYNRTYYFLKNHVFSAVCLQFIYVPRCTWMIFHLPLHLLTWYRTSKPICHIDVSFFLPNFIQFFSHHLNRHYYID